jgi:predicted RecB family endonuclease
MTDQNVQDCQAKLDASAHMLATARQRHAAALAAKAELIARAATPHLVVKPSELTEVNAEVELSGAPIPTLEAQLAAATDALQTAHAEALSNEVLNWYQSSCDSILEQVTAARAALQAFAVAALDHDEQMAAYRPRIEALAGSGGSRGAAYRGMRTVGGREISYASTTEWLARLAGEVMTALPHMAGHTVGQGLLATAYQVSPADPTGEAHIHPEPLRAALCRYPGSGLGR